MNIWSDKRAGLDLVEPDQSGLTPTVKRASIALLSRADQLHLIKLAAQIWLASRLGIYLTTYIVQMVIAWRHHQPIFITPTNMIVHWRQFDANDYTIIATNGYHSVYISAFFPLYPLCIAAVNALFLGQQVVLAGMLVNNLGALVGSIGLAFLALHEFHTFKAVRWTLLAFFAYPLAFFLAAPYSEGLFFASFAWCLWAMRRRIWWLAALLAFTATLTRITGIILVLPMLIEFFQTIKRSKNLQLRDTLPGILLAVSAPLALGLFMTYLWLAIGDPVGFYHAQKYFGHSTLFYPVGLLEGLHFYFSRPLLSFTEFRQAIDFLPLVGLTAVAIVALRKQPIAFTVLVIELFVLSTQGPKIYSSHDAIFVSAGRYMMMALPSFLLIGRWFERHERLAAVCCGCSFLVQLIFAVYFLQSGAII